MDVLILTTVLLIITAFSSSEMDTIKHPSKIRRPLIDRKIFRTLLRTKWRIFKNNWYMANNWKEHTYFKKTITAMLIDGWHWFKFFRIWSFSAIIALALMERYVPNISIYWCLLFGYAVTFIHGIFFEIFYQDILGI